jgi:hypothetical protein
MANGDKKIGIGLGVDEPSFRSALGLFTPLIKTLDAVGAAANRAFSAMSGGRGPFPGSMGGGGVLGRQTSGGGFGLPPQASGLAGGLIQGLRQNQAAMTALASGSAQTMNAMRDLTKRALVDQRNELKLTGAELDKLAASYKEAQQAAERLRRDAAARPGDAEADARAELASRRAARFGGRFFDKLGEATDLKSSIDDLERSRRQMGWQGTVLSASMVAEGVAKGMQRFAGAASATSNLVATTMSAADVNSAATMMTGNRILGELARGDVRGLVQLHSPSAKRIFEQYGDPTRAQLGLLSEIASGLASAGTGAAQGAAAGSRGGIGGGIFGGLLGAIPGVANAVGGIYKGTQGAIPGAQAGQVEAALLQERQFTPATQMAFDMMQQYAGIRVHGAKALQGRHFRALGIGSGYGLDFGQSVAQAEALLAATGDVGQVFGTRGGRAGGRQRMGAGAAAAAKAVGGGGSGMTATQMAAVDVGASMLGPKPTIRTDIASSATGMLYATATAVPEYGHAAGPMSAADTAALNGFTGAKRGAGGIRGYQQLTNDFMMMGFSQEAAMGSLANLGAAAQARGTGRLQAPEVAGKQLEEIFARGTQKAFDRDVISKFSEAIGKTMAESAFGPGGATGGYSQRLEVLMAGLDKNSTLRDVRNAGAARQAIDDVFQENQYFNMIAVSAGIKALQGEPGGGSGLQLRVLQRATNAELLGGTPGMTAAGVTEQQRMTALRGRNDAFLAIAGLAAGGRKPGETEAAYRDRQAAALGDFTGESFDVNQQVVRMLELERKGVFAPAPVLSEEERANLKKKGGDLASSVFRTQAEVIAEVFGFEKKQVAPLIKQMEKEGGVKAGLEAFLKDKEMATGQFTPGNEYVVQVIRGPLKKGASP